MGRMGRMSDSTSEITKGLDFPEGPIWCDDGSILLVEIRGGTLKRVLPDGSHKVEAEIAGGPNGAAVGPDGRVYICNNGGFEYSQVGPYVLPGNQPDDYLGGSIQAVDLATGALETLYSECDGERLKGPNDLVFDRTGGFWFTDHGKNRPRDRDRGGLYYAKADGSEVREVVFPLDSPNGVGLSPGDGKLYVAETHTGRLFGWDLEAPGRIAGDATPNASSLIAGLPGLQLLDSLAVDSAGHICVATLVNGGVTRISPDGSELVHYPMPDPLCTNVCFGGPGLRTAYVTLSATGRLVSMPWPVAGHPLHY